MFKNFSGKFYGLMLMCIGIEQLCNLMIICIVQDIGMDMVVKYVECFGVYDQLLLFLVNSLGVQEIMLFKMVVVYVMFVNGGEWVEFMLVDWVQDCMGCIIYCYDNCSCVNCNQLMLFVGFVFLIVINCEWVMDVIIVYQLILMMEGVVKCGLGCGV